ncbi:hypothetical protein NZL82_01550 [Sphingomonas sanguinis]|uniref:hypothetical protein n=1 Tax=Sphingomonas sp. LC-1 TaxID=3110957 RepID=UPI0021BA4C16|nr:hypothetical protein [Sphingomonas sp. LC-1]MCT8000556.1 hypothetical protein [Sphingomonas sp. LC-1]
MGKGGYNGGSSIIRAAVGFISGRSKPAAMSVDAKSEDRPSAKVPKSRKLPKTEKQKAADAEWNRKMTLAHQARRKGDPMDAVVVKRITKNTLRLRKRDP